MLSHSPHNPPYAQYTRKPRPTTKPIQNVPLDKENTSARTAVALEYASMRHSSHCPLGMYVYVLAESVMIWDCVFFVHQGYYADAVLKFRLSFPANYPEQPPVVHFVNDVFHPLISPESGLFNLAPRFRPWRPKEHHAFDVLHWLKAAFKKHALDGLKDHDCLNKEAFRLYHESTQAFANLATQSTQLSQTHGTLFHPSQTIKPVHGIQFREMKPQQLDAARTKLELSEWDELPNV
ncbi:ubiquitin-conjugating enzyme/RWD-like protein [Mycena floridula]|nr:ubiquitin-conjugating enzyme/RWD-like protein [Mycena floridula]